MQRTTAQPAPQRIPVELGWNAPGIFNILDYPAETTAVDAITALRPGFIRLYGGTLANYSSTTGLAYGLSADAPKELLDKDRMAIDSGRATRNYISEAVALLLAARCPVMWVANLRLPASHTITALLAFQAAGIQVLAVELGCEPYLNQYKTWYKSATNYLTKAKAYRDKVRIAFPDVKFGVCIAPDPCLKDLGDTPAERLVLWNKAVYKAQWPDHLVVHLYAKAADSVEYTSKWLPEAFANIKSHSSKPVDITEMNLFKSEADGTALQVDHMRRMLDFIEQEPRIQRAAAHSLFALGIGYNAIQRNRNIHVFTPLGAFVSDYRSSTSTTL